jgi:hypothetical protein
VILGLGLGLLLASPVACTPPRAPVGVRAAVGTLADLRARAPDLLPADLSEVLRHGFVNRLIHRERFGPETAPTRTLVITPELLSATMVQVKQGADRHGVPTTGETRLGYLPATTDGYRLAATIRLHVKVAQGGRLLKTYTVVRTRFQPHRPNADDVAELALLLAESAHDAINADFETLFKQVGGTP